MLGEGDLTDAEVDALLMGNGDAARALFDEGRPFLRYTLNTLIIVAGNIVGTVVSCSLVAFAFNAVILAAGVLVMTHETVQIRYGIGELAPRLVMGENIAQAHQFVASGNAVMGFVAWAQVAREGRSVDPAPVDARLQHQEAERHGDQARDHVFEAAQLAGRSADPQWEVTALLRLGAVLDSLGDHDDAAALQRRALALIEATAAP